MGQISIYNRALNLLGLDPVSSIAEGKLSSTSDGNSNTRTRALNTAWEFVVPELMASEPWLFATKRTKAAKLDEEALYGYSNVYQYPSDCLKLLGVDTGERYVRGDKIYSNNDDLYIEYTYYNKDTSKWFTGFTKCISYLLAIECCFKLLNSNTREQNLTTIYESKILPDAMADNAQQEEPKQVENILNEVGNED